MKTHLQLHFRSPRPCYLVSPLPPLTQLPRRPNVRFTATATTPAAAATPTPAPTQGGLLPHPSASAPPSSRPPNFHHVLHSVYKNPPDAAAEQLLLLEHLTLQRLEQLDA
ncbi:hypothetical protein Agub_g13341, partial [Astrephomene gubernaculifera]